MSDTAAATDLQLLARYTRDRAEDAFAELVRRHLNLVYSAALRQVRSPQLAEEVAQSAFTDLARNASALTRGSGDSSPGSLTPWLFTVTRRTAVDVVRREARRQLREHIATEMNALNAAAADWMHIEPLLDDAVSALDETDRTAVLLRYFENKSLREVGQQLGVSDDAAQKRVSRAVERLREFFAKRGVVVGTSGLAIAISASAVHAAPQGLAAAITSAAALTGATLAASATATTTKAIAMTTLQKTLVTATIAVLAGVGIYEAREISALRRQVQSLEQQRSQTPAAPVNDTSAALQQTISQLSTQNSDLAGALAQANADKTRLESERESAKRAAELFKELADQSTAKDTNPTNMYPTPRHVWMAFGKMGRLAALSKEDDSKLVAEEKAALDVARTKALEDLPLLIKAAKHFDTTQLAGTEAPPEEQLDLWACMLYGALNLDEQQFSQVYNLMQQDLAAAKQKGLSETSSSSDKTVALKQMIEQFKGEMKPLFTPEQARIFEGVLTQVQVEPGKMGFNFSF